ncbi:MAG TPA: immunity 52 family protein [Myxococcus sp.]|nr:immunity 52 family protein [Myxococcus sp.]
MSEGYYVGAYWLGRKESAEVCARRAETFFQRLGALASTWTRWFGTGRSRKAALDKPIAPLAASTFEALFAQKQHQQLEDGFLLWTWSGEPQGDATGVILSCGSSSQDLCDSCTLTPPRKGVVAEEVLSAPLLSGVLQAMALAWEPEWGVATSDVHRDDILKTATPGTFIGWLTYLSRRRGPVPPLPAPVRVEPVADLGMLVILTTERFTASNPDHVALAARVQTLLFDAGLLHPLKPGGA